MNDRLYRSSDDRILAGVAGGLAAQFRVDPSLIRILWVILVIPTGGIALLLYIVMALVVPLEPVGGRQWAHGPGGYRWPDDPAAGTGAPEASTDATVGPTPPAGDAGPTPLAGDSRPTATPTGTPPDTAPLGVPPGFTAAAAPGPAGGGPPPSARDLRRQARDDRREWRRAHRDSTAPLLFGLILILIGAFFLLRTYLPDIDLTLGWPVLLIVIGIVLLLGAFRRSGGSPTQ